MFSVSAEYGFTRRHINTGKYLSIFNDKKINLSLMHFLNVNKIYDGLYV